MSNQTKDLTHIDSIKIALDAGCRWIQLRVKDQPFENVLNTAIVAKNLCDNYHAKLIINDFPLVAKEVGAYGLHLGLNDMRISDAKKVVGNKVIIGGTANTLENIQLRINEGADYIGLGPLRFTGTKQNLSPFLGFKGYKSIMKSLKDSDKQIPIIAIGGIVPEDIAELIDAGVFGVAISSAIILAKNKKETVTNIYKTLC